MPPKQKVPAPIDRPLSRAYLREFSGWSTAYPPGMSEPTSLRIMENMMVNRDGSLRVRPGLRYVSYVRDAGVLKGLDVEALGSHETFYLNDGTRANLFAVRESDGTVGFRAMVKDTTGTEVFELEDERIGFVITQGYDVLRFSSSTTYVKYLQIDNKVLALSNAGEEPRYFDVGEGKTAKKLNSLERPRWDVVDKLAAVHPDAAWVNNSVPISTRRNLVLNPRTQGTKNWAAGVDTEIYDARLTDGGPASAAKKHVGLHSLPTRTNLLTNPLRDGGTISGWAASTNISNIVLGAGGHGLKATIEPGDSGRQGRVIAPRARVTPGQDYRAAFNLLQHSGISGIGFRIRFYNAWDLEVGSLIEDAITDYATLNRKTSRTVTAPANAYEMRVTIYAKAPGTGSETFTIGDACVALASEGVAALDGSMGANYFWEGSTDASVSIFHPPRDITVSTRVAPMAPGGWSAGLGVKQYGATPRNVQLYIDYLNSAGTSLGSSSAGTGTSSNTGASLTRITTSGTAPSNTNKGTLRMKILAVPRGEDHFVSQGLVESGLTIRAYFDGAYTGAANADSFWEGTADDSISVEQVFAGPTVPTAEARTVDTLISSDKTKNTYNFGFFYTLANEIGESAPSQVTTVRAQRAWSAWRWETPNAAGEPSGTETTDPAACADQLVAYLDQAVFDAAKESGATHWNLYMLTWGDQDVVPVTAVHVGSRAIEAGSTLNTSGWLAVTPQMTVGEAQAVVPQESTRYNSSDPGGPSQGLVAADRMILVADPTRPATIRWSSNRQGSYSNFSPALGGGFKTLTSGNLLLPAVVKLWQNPESKDTLTILCQGDDGYSSSYYMAPAQVSSQSGAVSIMGFEETTATPGTLAPYGCEVLNNALYHPVDEMLMKSTASNYNISHKTMTEKIQNMWLVLQDKQRIVSSQLDNRLYYIVNNPYGDELQPGCWGNEVWVLDTAAENGHWSRWKIQAQSLRKGEYGGRVVMTVVRPDGIFALDEDFKVDHVVDPDTRDVTEQPIAWRFETNTQGANRAHDAPAHLQQVGMTLGNWSGRLRWGIRSYDLNGEPIDISKEMEAAALEREDGLPYDREDRLLVRRDVIEWRLYAESTTDDAGATLPGWGQISLVQYRYTPVSVNVGYEHGSVETFEYRRSVAGAPSLTDAGVPQPMTDTRYP